LIGLIFKIKYHQQTLDFEYTSFFQFKIHLKPWSNIQDQVSLQVSSCHIQDRESFHWSTEAHGSFANVVEEIFQNVLVEH